MQTLNVGTLTALVAGVLSFASPCLLPIVPGYLSFSRGLGIEDDRAVAYGTYGLPDNYLFALDGSIVKHFIGLTSEEDLRTALGKSMKELAAHADVQSTTITINERNNNE